jgi:cellulose 1,4-beta-cellobiosidase
MLDVANYNALSAASPDPVTVNNPNTDELKYINALGPVLASQGFPASWVAIDTYFTAFDFQ